MGWIEVLRGSTVGVDTSALIYFIERNPTYVAKLRPFFASAEKREFRLVTSMVTLVEVLVQPLRTGRSDIAREYRTILLRSANLTTVPLREDIAEEAALLRARYKLRTPDAIQLATAKMSGASWFLTNDMDLPSLDGLPLLVIDRL